MTNKDFIKRLKNIDMIYKTDENGDVREFKKCGEIYKNHFKKLEKDLKILDILKEHFASDIVSDAARYRFFGKIDFEDEELIGEWLNDK